MNPHKSKKLKKTKAKKNPIIAGKKILVIKNGDIGSEPELEESSDSEEDSSSIKTDFSTELKRKKSKSEKEVKVDKPKTEKKEIKKDRIPPIIIKNTTIDNTEASLKRLGTTKYKLQQISVGTKIFLDNPEDHKVLIEALKQEEVDHYTFDYPNQKVNKIVIYGVPPRDTEQIQESLADQGAAPLSIKIINCRDQINKLYLLFYSKNSPEFENFKKVRDICRVIFSWKYYKNKSNNVPQCHNCQEMGHGSRNCGLSAKCVRCGDSHRSDKCPKADPDTNKVIESEVKCANCGGNHTANFNECPKRLEYIKVQQKLRQRNSEKQAKQMESSQSVSFAEVVKKANQTKDKSWIKEIPWNHQSQDSTLHRKFSNKNNTIINNDNLFSSDEIMSIFMELLEKLKNCSSKIDQLRVTMEITTKYLFPVND